SLQEGLAAGLAARVAPAAVAAGRAAPAAAAQDGVLAAGRHAELANNNQLGGGVPMDPEDDLIEQAELRHRQQIETVLMQLHQSVRQHATAAGRRAYAGDLTSWQTLLTGREPSEARRIGERLAGSTVSVTCFSVDEEQIIRFVESLEYAVVGKRWHTINGPDDEGRLDIDVFNPVHAEELTNRVVRLRCTSRMRFVLPVIGHIVDPRDVVGTTARLSSLPPRIHQIDFLDFLMVVYRPSRG
ncbi:hypothetical protein PFISCL1PPCAC_7282, partial [Pristionchus fissidentatus]